MYRDNTYRNEFAHTLEDIKQGDERRKYLLCEPGEDLDKHTTLYEGHYQSDEQNPDANVHSHGEVLDVIALAELGRKKIDLFLSRFKQGKNYHITPIIGSLSFHYPFW